MKSQFYFFARLPIGLSMLGHGLIRLPKLQSFAQGMTDSFAQSYLPSTLVYGFGLLLPILELLVGLLIVLGLFTRIGLTGGLLVMSMLVFGSTVIENWNAISSQLIHSGYMALLLYYVDYNTLSIDKFVKQKA